MRVVNVAHFESGAVAVKTAGAERGKLTFMRKFCGGVGLVHKLRKLGRTEEFADNRGNGAHVDKTRGSYLHSVLRGHTFLYKLFKPCDTYAQLVLQQFAHRAHAAVAEVVDVVDSAYAVLQVDIGRNGRDDVVDGDVLVVKLFDNGLDFLLLVLVKACLVGRKQFVELLARHYELHAHIAPFLPVFLLLGLFVLGFGSFGGVVDCVDFVDISFRNLFGLSVRALCRHFLHKLEVGIIDCRQKAENLVALIGYRREVDGVVCDYLVPDFAVNGVGNEYKHFVHARVLHFKRLCLFHDFARVRHYFARFGIEYVVCELTAGQTVSEVELFIELIPAHFHHVVAARVEKQVVEVLFNGRLGGNFAGAQPSVKLDKAVGLRLRGVLRNGVFYHLIVCKQV